MISFHVHTFLFEFEHWLKIFHWVFNFSLIILIFIVVSVGTDIDSLTFVIISTPFRVSFFTPHIAWSVFTWCFWMEKLAAFRFSCTFTIANIEEFALHFFLQQIFWNFWNCCEMAAESCCHYSVCWECFPGNKWGLHVADYNKTNKTTCPVYVVLKTKWKILG